MNISAPRDNNRVPTLIGTSSVDNVTPVNVWVDPSTHRLLVDSTGGGSSALVVGVTTITGGTNGFVLFDNNGVLGEEAVSGTGTVTSVTSADANATVATTTTTPVITIVSAPKLQTARTIAGVSFDGTANISLNNNAITNGAGYTTNTGTVTSIAVTTANGVSGTSSGGATPSLTITLGAITPTSTNGVSAATMAFMDATSSVQTQLNAKQGTITLTTTGTSGAATFSGGTLNIPQYAGSTYTGTTDRITVTGTVIDIAATYVGQSSITTLGTVTTGTWTGTTIAIANGGTGQTSANAALNAFLPTQATNSGKFLTTDGTNTSWATAGSGSGTVTSVSVVSANGFTGTVATSTTTPAITLTTSITGVLKGNGTAISAAVADTDYQSPLTFTTTGTSGAATFSGHSLNIPNYTYTLPTASVSVLGGVKVDGTSITISGGVISATTGGSGTVTSVTSATGDATVATTTTTPVITIVSAPKWTTARNLAGNSVDGSGNVAFANKFIVQGTTDSGLSSAQFLGALGTGIVKNTTTTGVLSIASDGTDYLSPTTGITVSQSTGQTLGTTGNRLTKLWATDITVTNAISGSVTGNAGTATALATGRTISITGDIAYTSPSFDGSGNVTAAGTLATVNSNVGSFTYASITVNAKGLITAASNGTAPLTNPMTTLGDIIYEDATPAPARLAGNTTTTKKYLQQTGTGTISAVPAWATIAASEITSGAALTKTDDTNVTLTLGGTPSTALLAATSVTVGWTGTLAVARGGTGGGSASITLFNNITGLSAAGTTGTTSTNLVFSTSPTLVTPALGTPSALVGTNITGTGAGFTSGITQALASATTTVNVSSATAPSSGQVLTATSGTAATWQTPSGGASITKTINQTSHGLSVGNVIRYSGTAYVTAKADSGADAEVVGIVTTVIDANNFTFTEDGYVTGLTGLTAGTTYFLDPSTAGALTATEPSTAGQVSIPLLVADSTTTGYFHKYRGLLITASGSYVNLGSGSTGQFASTLNTLTSSSSITVNWNNGLVQEVTLGVNTTLTFSNPISGAHYTLIIIQDGTGSRTVTWPTIRWAGGSAPTLTTAANKADVIALVYDGTSYFGVPSLNF